MPKGIYQRHPKKGSWKKSRAWRKAMSQKMMGNQNAKGKMLNEKHPNWKGGRYKEKGNKVGLSSLHEWVRRRKLKPKFCVDCKKVPPVDLANISQKYHRDINDFEWLCRRCHMTKDGRIENFKAKKQLKDISCQYCKKIVSPKSSEQKFCSYECSRKGKIINGEINCKNCKKVFKKRVRTSQFCSYSCSAAGGWLKGKRLLISIEARDRKEKECTKCKIVKPVNQFYYQTIKGKKYINSSCKLCKKIRMKIYDLKRCRSPVEKPVLDTPAGGL